MKKLSKAEKQKRGTLDNRHKDPVTGKPMESLPPAPDWLSETAAEIFLDVSCDLFERGLLYDADLTLIASYCSQIAQYIELTEMINSEGYVYEDKNGQKRKHPALIPQRSAFQSAVSTAKTLGLGPYFRDKVTAVEQEDDDYVDPLAGLMEKWANE